MGHETCDDPVKVIFETDMGNDVDDAMALDLLYKYVDQTKVDLLAISTNKANRYSAPFVDVMNNWYGHASVPIGVVQNGVNSDGESHNFAKTVVQYKVNGQLFFKTNLDCQYSGSVRIYRRILSKQADTSVVIISVGFMTNLAQLLESPPDEFSSLTGKELIKKKVKFLSAMAGNFNKTPSLEYNVKMDIPAATKVFDEWPTAIVVSPFEVGNSILYPAKSIEYDFNWAEHHPMVIAYKNYLPMPHNRPTWDLTSVLYSIEKESGYFSLSKPGTVKVDQAGYTGFRKKSTGKHRILQVNTDQRKKILDRFVELITTKPRIYQELSNCNTTPLNHNTIKNNILEEEFINPNVKFRPMRMIHGNLDGNLIEKLAQYGYGGIVTNVSYENYLKSEQNWITFEKNIKNAIDHMGMRIWIYDEKGYPSGTAGGLVLAEQPELEAQGLAVISESINNQGEINITHPKGHGKIIFARAYKKNEMEINLDSMIDLQAFVNESGNLKWKAPKGNWVLYYFVQKPLYEGTHATHNWAEKRRYINIMDNKATESFIKLTHQKYFKHVGKYFGKGIEAFFTDEPSLLSTYFTGYNPPRTPPILDIPDSDFTLYPTLNWSNSFLDEFKIRRGYDIYSYLPYLVVDHNEKAREIRRDYYKTITELVAENYFGVLENFCSVTGVASSGHLLLEENIYLHPGFEGDIMAMYKRMHFPGIDLLTAYPKKAMEWGATAAKLASSVANYYGKEHVMSEISNAFDSDDAGIGGMTASAGVQFAYGIDMFQSYYDHNKMTEAENREFTDYIGRVGYILSHGERNPQVVVYNPIESIWENTFPAMTLNPQDFNPKAVSLSDNFKNLAIGLVKNHIDFDFMGYDEIMNTEIEDNKLITSAGEKFELLIIPSITLIPPQMPYKIQKMAEAGVKIIIQDKFSFETIIKDSASSFCSNKLNYDHVEMTDNLSEIVDLVKNSVSSKVRIDDKGQEVVMLHKCSPTLDLYLFVNTGDSLTLNLNFISSGREVKLWDPQFGKVSLPEVKRNGNEITTELTLGKWETAIVSIDN